MEEKYVQLITETSERAKSNSHRIEEMGIKIDKLAEQNTAIIEMGTSFKLLNQEMKHMREDTDKNFNSIRKDVGELSDTVKQTQKDIVEIKEEPAKRKVTALNKFGWLVISAITSGAVGFVLGTLK